MASDSVEVRVAAARTVAAVFAGRSLDQEIPSASARLPVREHALYRVMVLGTVRDHGRLSAIIERMVPRPPPANTVPHALLVLGLYQLIHMRSAEHAAVNETVAAAEAAGSRAAKGLINGVLRRFQRERLRIVESLPDDPAIRYSYPHWLVERIRRDWPDRWETILQDGNQRAPITLRINPRQRLTDDYLHELSRHGTSASPLDAVPTAVTLESRTPVTRLPGYADGVFAVQDAAAQLAVPLLDPRDGHRVLDACAAPGGKTCHILEQAPEATVLALDQDAERLHRVRENLVRLRLQAEVRQGDACTPQAWWDGTPFDRILVDAPCSGTGVIRRHPDIKWLRRGSDIQSLARRQRTMLEALWPLLADDGQMVFATCSILADEGDGVIGPFVTDHADASVDVLDLPRGERTEHGWRVPPGGAFDGFYYARLRRRDH